MKYTTTQLLKEDAIKSIHAYEKDGKVMVCLDYDDKIRNPVLSDVVLAINPDSIAGWLRDNFKRLISETDTDEVAMFKQRLDYIFCSICTDANQKHDIDFLIETIEGLVPEFLSSEITIMDLLSAVFDDINPISNALKQKTEVYEYGRA
jgi:hypothetical protein